MNGIRSDISRQVVSTRLATAEDASAIAAFQKEHAWEIEQIELSQSTVSQGVLSLIQSPEFGFYLVAEGNDEEYRGICGVLGVTLEWSDWRNGKVWWLQSVFVDAAWRCKGVFRALFGEVTSRAKASGAVGLRLYVDRRNTAAQAVYRRMGMTSEHYEMFEKMFR